MSIFNLSEFTIRRHANAKSFQRGEAYYAAGAVISLIQRGKWLQAEVQGLECQPAYVSVYGDEEGVNCSSCTCNYDLEDWCKHIVCTLLACLREPERIEQRPSLSQLLQPLDYRQTQRLIQELVAENPQLIDVIEEHIHWMAKYPEYRPCTSLAVNVDIEMFRQQVDQILQDGVENWLDAEEEDPIIEKLWSLVEIALDYNDRGEGIEAIAILSAITSSCVENWHQVADYGFDQDAIAQEFNLAWCEIILSTTLTPEERVDLQVELETWQDEWDADFSLSLEALHQDWDDPELMEILAGHSRGISDYSDRLVFIRLKILKREGRYEEYLNLAQATGQTQEYLEMLTSLGRVQEAMTVAFTHMTSIEQAFTFAKNLRAKGALSQALNVAKTGLNLPGDCHDDLGVWTSDLAQELGDNQTHLLAIRAIFKEQPSLDLYHKIAALSGKNWQAEKQNLLAIMRRYGSWGTEAAKVEIFLSEGLIDDAINIVRDLSPDYSPLIQQVMTAAIPHQPGWVIANGRRRAELIINASKSEQYADAIQWLKQVRAAYLASNRQPDWVKYRQQLIENHGRKRKFMTMFNSADME